MILSLTTTESGEFRKYISDEIKPDSVVLFNYQEWAYKRVGSSGNDSPFTWNELIDYINSKDCQLYVINGDFEGSPIQHDHFNPKFKNVNLIHHPFHFLYLWHDRFYLKKY
jgi:hypothetical protein